MLQTTTWGEGHGDHEWRSYNLRFQQHTEDPDADQVPMKTFDAGWPEASNETTPIVSLHRRSTHSETESPGRTTNMVTFCSRLAAAARYETQLGPLALSIQRAVKATTTSGEIAAKIQQEWHRPSTL